MTTSSDRRRVDPAGAARAPWRPRALAPSEGEERERIARAFRGAGARLPLPRFADAVGEEEAHGAVAAIRPPSAPAPGAVPIALCSAGDAGGPAAVLCLGLAHARRTVDAALRRRATPADRPLAGGEEGALLYALDRAAGDLLAAGGAPFRITGILAGPDQIPAFLGAPPRHEVVLDVLAGDAGGRAAVLLAAPGEPASAARCPGDLGRAAGWTIRFLCATGEARLPASDASSLRRGDVVVLDACGHPAAPAGGGFCRLSSGGASLDARWLDDRRIVLLSRHRRDGMKESGTGEIGVRLEAPLEGGAMEVVAQVEVGRIALTVEQALGLVPGRVLSLDRPVGPDVWLKVGDRTIAKGELVSCDGRLAVEVTEVP